jgi:hypothetical protein
MTSRCTGLHPYGPCAPGKGCNRERFAANDDDPAVLRELLSEARRERDALVGRARMLRAERDAALDRIAELEIAGRGLSISLDATRRRLAELEAAGRALSKSCAPAHAPGYFLAPIDLVQQLNAEPADPPLCTCGIDGVPHERGVGDCICPSRRRV